MLRFRTVISLTLALLAGSSRLAAQTVVTFESLGAACNNVAGNVSVYDGIDFGRQWGCYRDAQEPYTAKSGTARIYGADESGATSTQRFAFLGTATFLGAWVSGNGQPVTFRMWLSGLLVATSSTLTTSIVPTFLASGYSGAVDQVEVVGQFRRFVLDDITYRNLTTVPEPSTYVLMASGLAGLFFAAGRRRR